MKKSLAIVSLLALGTSAMAVDVQPYIGAGAGISWNKLEATASMGGVTESETQRENATLMIFKGGVILDNAHRISLNYAPAIHSDANVHNILASYDYLIPVNSENRFYVGAHAGVSKFQGKDDISDLNMSGFAYGAQAGYIYDITKNVEFEIGAMYTKQNADKTIADYEGTGVSLKAELKDTISTFVGINYKF